MEQRKLKSKGILARTAGLLGVFAVLLIALYLFMVFSAAIPNEAIRENMIASARYELTVPSYELPENGRLQQVADHHADQIWLNIAWQMGEGNPFVSALDTKYYDGGSFGEAAGLHQAVTRGQAPNRSYTRYWHGGAACLRVLHLWTDIQGIKTLGLLCLLLGVSVTVWMLIRQQHGKLALCLIAALMAVQAWQMRLSAEYQPCFLICFFLCPAFLALEKHGDTPLAMLSVTAGVMTAFFDFLTVESITILVPLILVTAVRCMDGRLGSPKENASLVLDCLCCWGVAYGSTFAVKWVCVSELAGGSHILAALQSAGERLGGSVLVKGVERDPGALLSIGANLSALFGAAERTDYGRVLLGLLLVAAVVYVLSRMCRIRRGGRRGTGMILGLGAIVLVRYGLLANHSYLHAFFTYRALLSTILAVLTALVMNYHPREKERQRT